MSKNLIFFTVISIILVTVVGVGAMVYSGKIQSKIPYEKTIQKIERQSTSDELVDIESDLNQTDLVELDKELSSIEKELFSAQ